MKKRVTRSLDSFPNNHAYMLLRRIRPFRSTKKLVARVGYKTLKRPLAMQGLGDCIFIFHLKCFLTAYTLDICFPKNYGASIIQNLHFWNLICNFSLSLLVCGPSSRILKIEEAIRNWDFVLQWTNM
jgi:hypothetical protein